jgi:hypothetical protein
LSEHGMKSRVECRVSRNFPLASVVGGVANARKSGNARVPFTVKRSCGVIPLTVIAWADWSATW